MAQRRHIDVVVETNPGTSAAILRGVTSYGAGAGDWTYTLRWPGDRWLAESLNRRWCDGMMIVRLPRAALEAVVATGRPVVALHATEFPSRIPSVVHDNVEIGRIGGRHLLRLGLTQLAFHGLDLPFSEDRKRGFCEELEQAGVPCLSAPGDGAVWDWDQSLDPHLVRRWLASLPRPVEVMSATDQLAAVVINAAAELGLRVPEEVAVLGVDNTEFRCELLRTPLSSVDPNVARLAYEAAALLDRLMQGESAPKEPLVVPPLHVVERRSTQRMAIRDEDLIAAVYFIRHYACEGISVDDVIDHVNISRSSLERRFREHLRCSPGEEIRRVRLEAARQLLLTTDLNLFEIVARCGFTSISYLSRAFKQAHGLSPSAYRRQRTLPTAGLSGLAP